MKRIPARLLQGAALLLTTAIAQAQSSPTQSYEISEAQYKIVQQCGNAVSTAAEAFRRFPKDEKRRMEFVNEVDANLPRGKADGIEWPTPFQIVSSLLSMEMDHPINAKSGTNSSNDLFLARAAARCALYTNNYSAD